MRPSERWWNRWRGMLLITLLSLGWGFGLRPLALEAQPDEDYSVVVQACRDELRQRLPAGQLLRFHSDVKTHPAEDGLQVLSSFESPRGRTHFSCETQLNGGVWRVTELLAVNW